MATGLNVCCYLCFYEFLRQCRQNYQEGSGMQTGQYDGGFFISPSSVDIQNNWNTTDISSALSGLFTLLQTIPEKLKDKR